MTRPLALLASVALLACVQAAPAQDKTFLFKTADGWAKQLGTAKDAAARRNAAFALGKMGSYGATALNDLKQCLGTEKDAKVREAIVTALGEIVPESLKAGGDADVETLLINATNPKTEDKLVRRSAVVALGRIGSKSDKTRAALAASLRDPAPEVRQNTAWALGLLGEGAVDPLRKVLADPDALVRRDAAGSLSLLAKDNPEVVRPALPELLKMCADANADARKNALRVLVKIADRQDKAGLKALRPSLSHPDLEVRRHAALVMGNIGSPDSAEAVPVLLDMLRRGDLEDQRAAVTALHGIGKDAPLIPGLGAEQQQKIFRELLQELVTRLASTDPELSRGSALALGGIGPKADAAAPALAQIVCNASADVDFRVEAAEAIAQIGAAPKVREEIPKLLAVLGDPNQSGKVRVRIAWLFNSVANEAPKMMPDAYPVFTKVCSEPRTKEVLDVRNHCAYLLGVLQQTKAPDAALNVLGEWLHDDSGRFYFNKQTTAGATGAEASGQSTVREVLQGDSRVMAVDAIRLIGVQRVRLRQDIVKQLGVLANNAKTAQDLRVESAKVLKMLQ